MNSMPSSDDLAKAVLDKINEKELVDLVVQLCSVDSPPGHEGEAAEFVFNWLTGNGLDAKRVGMLPERFCVVGRYRGTGGGYSLIFNSHLDTSDDFSHRKAWVDGDSVFGAGVVNDKGPMACFLIAVKAIKDAGIKLKGDLITISSPGEIDREPVDEFTATEYLSKEVGPRYAVTHGTVADYALVAEATNFTMVWVDAGKALFKITVRGNPRVYIPYLQRPTTMERSPNAIVRMAKVIEEFENWAYKYEKENTQKRAGGTVIPKVNIGAIRGGEPFHISRSVEECTIYVDVRLTPDKNPVDVKAELEELLRKLSMEGDVELFAFRRGYEAENISRLAGSVEKAHLHLFGEKPRAPDPPVSSMWRDNNIFNEQGIPSLNYGPGPRTGGRVGVAAERIGITKQSLLNASKVYALTALNLCSQSK